jgi:hypothetical protein
MRKISGSLARIAAGGTLVGLGFCGFVASPALAGGAAHGSAQGMTFDLGSDPNGLPSSCQFANGDANFVFLSGSGVAHESSNKNGDWGGETVQGPAQFYEGSTLIDTGHLTIWGGGGNNAKAQTEGGLTLNFVGSAVTIHVNFHGTTNAAGTPTSNVVNVEVTCTPVV